MELIKPGVTIPFTRYRYIAVAISSVINLFVLILLFTRGPLLGVDFAGGTVAQLKFSKPVTIGEIRNALGELGAGDTVIQDFGQQGSNEFLVRLQKTSAQLGELSEQIKEGLTKQFGSGTFEVRRIESVGPKVGSELRQKGAWSVIAATIMMGIYIWLRFDLRFGLGAVVALIHDVLVTIGALIVANYEFDLTIIAALLTVVGFSVNETLSRTIITTGTAILVLLALFVLGGGVIRPFAFALLVGFFSGVYSTIFIASPVVLFWEKRPVRKSTSTIGVSAIKK